jgi:heat shock protein HslJ
MGGGRYRRWRHHRPLTRDLNFAADGQLFGRASCNRYQGQYTLDGDTLTISRLAGTLMACAPALMHQEDKFLGLLKQVQKIERDDTGALILVSESKQRILARRE